MLEMVILGLVQGLTEFLPVSSTAHLLFAEAFLGVTRPGILLEAVLHLGTALAALILFWPDVRRLLIGWWATLTRRPEPEPRGYGRLAWLIILITLITAAVGLALAGPFEQMFGSVRGAAMQLVLTGLILLAARGPEQRDLLQTRVVDAVGIGAAQVISIIPGISRSGTTITAGLWLGLRRDDAARLSFLAAIPAVAGAGIFGLKDLGLGQSFGYTGAQLLAGFIVALLSGALAIRWLLVVVRRGQLQWFAAYCIAAGAAALITVGR